MTPPKRVWSLAGLFFIFAGAPRLTRAAFSSSDAGVSAGAFLALTPGARELALGETGAATARGADAVYWNPAALGEAEARGRRTRDVAFSHSFFVDGVTHNFIGVEGPLDHGAGYGASLTYLDAGSIEQVDDAGSAAGQFHPRDAAFAAGASMGGETFRVGAAGKYISSRIIDSASAWTGDAGALALFSGGRLRVGVVGQNLTGRLTYGGLAEPLPRIVRVGVARSVADRVEATVEAVGVTGAPFRLAGGAEYNAGDANVMRIHLRGGYSGALAAGKNGFSGATFGVGLEFRSVRMDYAWVPLGILGQTHHLSLGFRP